jgi:hypothetical protein
MNETEMTEVEIAEMLKRCSAATPGPWTAYIEGRDHESGSDFVMTARDDIELSGASHADYDFIAHARQDIPRLIAEVRRLRALLAATA